MSTATEVRITPGDLGSIPRKVGVIVCELVNNHGVRYRMQNNGGHLYLYNGDVKSRPYKISASRPEETSLIYLNNWIDLNVPEYRERPVNTEAIKALAEAVNTSERDRTEDVEAEEVDDEDTPDVPDFVMPKGWREHKYGFITDGKTYRCTHPDCGFSLEGARGVHLHARTHNESTAEERSAQASEAGRKRALRREQKRTMERQAARLLAEAYGFKVLDPGEEDAELAAVRVELEDAKARLALIRETMKI